MPKRADTQAIGNRVVRPPFVNRGVVWVSSVLLAGFAVCACGKRAGSDYFTIAGNPIPDLAHEVVPWRVPGSKFARSATYLVRDEYAATRDRLLERIDNRFGRAWTQGDIINLDAEVRKLNADPQEQVRWEHLRPNGARLDGVERIRVTSDRYNIRDEVSGYSRMHVTIADASQILSCKCSVVSVTRVDHWRTWGEEPLTRLPIPWKLPTMTDLVTSTEMAFLEAAGMTRPIFARLWWDPVIDLDVLEELHARSEETLAP